MSERDLDTKPYSADEQRVADFLYERGAGGGDDPIGFILSSYAYVVAERNDALNQLVLATTALREVVRSNPVRGRLEIPSSRIARKAIAELGVSE